MEILRPLVGKDKDEISEEAARLGTLPISNIPDQDCCQLFTPRHPATRARLEAVLRAEEALTIPEMVLAAIASSTVEEFEYPVIESLGALETRARRTRLSASVPAGRPRRPFQVALCIPEDGCLLRSSRWLISSNLLSRC